MAGTIQVGGDVWMGGCDSGRVVTNVFSVTAPSPLKVFLKIYFCSANYNLAWWATAAFVGHTQSGSKRDAVKRSSNLPIGRSKALSKRGLIGDYGNSGLVVFAAAEGSRLTFGGSVTLIAGTLPSSCCVFSILPSNITFY